LQGNLPGLTRRLEELASELAAQSDQPGLQQEYDACLARIELTVESAGQAPAILAGFGLDSLPAEMYVGALSGGQKTRLQLASLLLANPRLLLLDEPTNHLDQEMLEWLEGWLRRAPCTVLMVSHDRVFLERTADAIYEIDPASHTLKVYTGNYSAYLEQKSGERERAQQEYSDQQDEIARLTQTARRIRGNAHFKKGGKADTGDKFARGFFANRSLETLRRAKAIEARVERLLNEDHIDKPRDSWRMKMEFDGAAESGRDVIVLSNLSIGYDDAALLSGMNAVLRFGQRAVLTGANGCGKTTLLRTITGQIPALTGRFRLGTGQARVHGAGAGRPGRGCQRARQPAACLRDERDRGAHISAQVPLHGDEVFTP
jgi:ATPase subunit of ABC transporter with duplicated ATPase domains